MLQDDKTASQLCYLRTPANVGLVHKTKHIAKAESECMYYMIEKNDQKKTFLLCALNLFYRKTVLIKQKTFNLFGSHK